MIENRGGSGLATCQGHWRWLSVSQAIRFVRREDAEQVLSVVRAALPRHLHDEVSVTEHSWPGEKP
ncbi:MAG: hypothetical protein ACF8XB_09795 [Planctomycetota bacterium JB042]